jgi:hypothetical protein
LPVNQLLDRAAHRCTTTWLACPNPSGITQTYILKQLFRYNPLPCRCLDVGCRVFGLSGLYVFMAVLGDDCLALALQDVVACQSFQPPLVHDRLVEDFALPVWLIFESGCHRYDDPLANRDW